MQLAHAALWTKDLDAASTFWEKYFNATVGETYFSKRRVGFESRFVTWPDSQLQIELMKGPWLEDKHQQDTFGWDHIAITLGSKAAVEEMALRCEKDGLLLSAPRMTGDGFYEAVIAMPDGTSIEIVE